MGFSEEKLIDIAKRELREMLNLQAEPFFSYAIKHIEALPVFRVGHSENVQRIESFLQDDIPGLILGGSGFYGTGIEKCIENSKRCAKRLELFLQTC